MCGIVMAKGHNVMTLNPLLLIVDDDTVFRERLSQAMASRGYRIIEAESKASALKAIFQRPAYAIIDMRLQDGSGLDVVHELRKDNAGCRIVVLTGYGNIVTAVAAIKTGAVDYLPKPADADQIDAALKEHGKVLPSPPEMPMAADRVRWEHIQRVYEQCDRNISETARRLRMHRRTLQRMMRKHMPK
jgi:two-component system, response regulator RegA